ncbi:hypothetical protein [Streptomyces umbrinus]|uniref:hypothetical protein n=1 Tax=Streptomyces umbrinus TaxID=67370 RepID=UPI0033E6B249
MTTTPIHHSRAETPETAATIGTSVRRTDMLMISELLVTTLLLEHLAQTAGPPEDESTAHMNGITTQQVPFVLSSAHRIRAALDKITAPYGAPAPSKPPSHHTAVDGGDDHADDPLPYCEVPTAVEAFEETTALCAALTGDRATFAGLLDALRRLLGPLCDNCGNLTELGTSTTDPFSETCRFLCGRCWPSRSPS